MEFLVNIRDSSRVGMCGINNSCGVVACGVNVAPCVANVCNLNIGNGR